MNGNTNTSLSQIKFFKIEIIVKILFKIIRRKDPIELNYKLKINSKFGSLVGATIFYNKQR